MKKIVALLICFVMLAGTLASCSSLKEGEKGASISVYLASFPKTLDPAFVQLNSDTSQILGLIFESLTKIDDNGKVVGALANKWYPFYDTREDAHKMYFELNETGWSDGRAVSAQDIVDAWKRILSPEIDSPYASMLYPIKNAKLVKTGMMTSDDLGISAVEPLKLEVTFEKFENNYDYNLFAETVSNIHLAPIREDAIARALKDENEQNRDWAANATSILNNGPFRVQSFDEGDKIILERNTYYMRDTEDDALDKTVLPYRIVCNYAEKSISGDVLTQIEYQTKRFEDGKIFYLSAFNKDTYAKFGKDVKTAKTTNSYVYYFNTQNEVLKNPKVRQALSVALDRNKIVTEITGTGEVAATGYVPSGVFYTGRKDDFRAKVGNLYETSANIEKAKQLLNEAGVKSGSFTLTYLIPESATLIKNNEKKVNYANVYEAIAKEAKSTWESLGFTVELKGLNPDKYLEALYKSEFDVLGINNIIDAVDAFAYLAPFSKYFSGSKVSVNFDQAAYAPHYTGLQSDEYDALIDKINGISNRDERAKLLSDAEKMFVDLCPATAVYYYSTSYVKSGKLSNINSDYFGMKNFNDLKLKNYREINAKEEEEAKAQG